MFIKSFRCVLRHKFSRVKDCYLIKKIKQQETYDFVCRYCGETLAEVRSIHNNNNKIINEYIIKCKLLTCVNNYNGYCYSKDKENELKSIHKTED
ncbi:TPA: hypothetical protein STU28_002707 [Clostridioides difficile]|nr:hypothetical protein [Clostridioides difficile]